MNHNVKATTSFLLVLPDMAVVRGHPQSSRPQKCVPAQTGPEGTASIGVTILGALPFILGSSMPACPGLLAPLANSG